MIFFHDIFETFCRKWRRCPPVWDKPCTRARPEQGQSPSLEQGQSSSSSEDEDETVEEVKVEEGPAPADPPPAQPPPAEPPVPGGNRMGIL